MELNWDNIKYLFQIPINWFKSISDRVFKAYGSNFIKVKEGYYGGTEIGIDQAAFNEAVKNVTDLSGYVTVNTEQTITGAKTFANTMTIQSPSNDGHMIFQPSYGQIEIYTYEGRGNGGYIDFHTDGNTTDFDSRIIDLANELQLRAKDKHIRLYAEGTSKNIELSATGITLVKAPATKIANADNTSYVYIYPEEGRIEISPKNDATNGGYIDFHYAGSATDYTSRIIDSQNEFSIRGVDKATTLYSYYNGTPTGILIKSDDNGYQQLLANEPPRLYSQGLDNQIATRGYCRLNFARASHTHGNINNDGQITGTIASAPGWYIAADNLGNLYRCQTTQITSNCASDSDVEDIYNQLTTNYATKNELTNFVEQNELTNYATHNELTSYVQQSELTDYVTQNELTNYVTQNELTDYATQSDIADLVTEDEVETYVETQLLDYVKSVDGLTPLANGDIDFNLASNKWMKTDANGHLATTNETPISLSSNNNGYLYANNGQLQFKNDEYVTLSSEQTITGKKRFTQNDVTIVDNSLLIIDASSSSNGTSVSKNGLTINASTPFVNFSTPGTAANDAFIAMTAASGYRLGIDSPNGIDITAPANQAKLANTPTDTSTTSKAIATCGYVQSKCITIDKTQYTPVTTSTPLTIVTDVVWNGTTLQKKTRTLTFNNGVLVTLGNETTTTIDTPVAYSPS